MIIMVIIEKDFKLTLAVIQMRSLGQFETFYFFYDKFSQVQKSTKKHQKALKSIKKYLKTSKSKKVTFLQ